MTPFERLLTLANVQNVDRNGFDDWIPAGSAVVFFSGLSKKRPETGDVAVVLSEMIKTYRERIPVAVIAAADEDFLREKFGVRVLPALVFIKNGTLMQAVFGIRDWSVYQAAFAAQFGLPE